MGVRTLDAYAFVLKTSFDTEVPVTVSEGMYQLVNDKEGVATTGVYTVPYIRFSAALNALLGAVLSTRLRMVT